MAQRGLLKKQFAAGIAGVVDVVDDTKQAVASVWQACDRKTAGTVRYTPEETAGGQEGRGESERASEKERKRESARARERERERVRERVCCSVLAAKRIEGCRMRVDMRVRACSNSGTRGHTCTQSLCLALGGQGR